MFDNYKLLKSVTSNLSSGCPFKLIFHEKKFILKSVRLNPRIAASQIVNNIREKLKNKTLNEDTILEKDSLSWPCSSSKATHSSCQ